MQDKQTYGRVDKFLHWLIVINLGLTLVAARGMADLPIAERVHEYGDHGLSTTTLLILMSIRLVWRLTHPAPELPATMKPRDKRYAKWMHRSLYGVIFAQIGVGFLLASTTKEDFVPKLYGFNYTSFELVPIKFHDAVLTMHHVVYWTIVSLIALHVLAALKHEFIDKDNVLRRMLPFVSASR